MLLVILIISLFFSYFFILFYYKTDPRLTDYDTLLQNVNDLKAGKEVQVPVYDFKSSSRTGFRLNASPFNDLHSLAYPWISLRKLLEIILS